MTRAIAQRRLVVVSVHHIISHYECGVANGMIIIIIVIIRLWKSPSWVEFNNLFQGIQTAIIVLVALIVIELADQVALVEVGSVPTWGGGGAGCTPSGAEEQRVILLVLTVPPPPPIPPTRRRGR